MKITKLFILTLLLNIGALHADVVTVKIPKNVENIKSVKGLVVSSGKIQYIDNVKYTNNNTGILITFDVKNLNDLIGAYVEDDNSEKYFSSLKSGAEYVNGDNELPLCKNPKVDISMLSGNESTIKQIIETRKDIQRTFRNKNLNEMLDDNMIYVLTNLEKYFGLTYDKPLSRELANEDLLIRLSYLKLAIKNLDVHKLNRIRVEKEGFRSNKE